MSTLYPVENVTPRQTRLYWDAHVPLALRVHVGMNGYIREWIEEPLSDAKSPIFGVASMHFENLTDMRERFFDSPASVPIHAADVARFVSSAAPMITTRYLLK
jgi:serine/threonine protein kinase HipA of HipAB toxin-antitoxin module